MNELFGLSMTAIMAVLLVLFALCLGSFLSILVVNPTMFRIGLRNIRRRSSQTALIVSGLMLATIIITAAFTTGDIVDHSVTKTAYDILKRTDLSIHHVQWLDETGEDGYMPAAVTAGLENRFANDPDIEGFMPFLYEHVAFENPRTKLAEPNVVLAGFDAGRLDQFGGLTLVSGERVDLRSLGSDEALVGESAAEETDSRQGDTIHVFTQRGATPLTVAGIVRDERAGGHLELNSLNVAVRLETAQAITGHTGQLTTINVALRGGVRGSLERSEPAALRLDAVEASDGEKVALGLAGARFQVERVKGDSVDDAKLAASVFTTMFLILGLFSIAAGAMLIFTLFVMLAAERRREMGIARAIGAQRSQLVLSFISEGMVYDLIAGAAGVLLGVIAAFVLVVGGARYLIGGELSFMSPTVSATSLVVSLCLGAVLTFLTVIMSSIRVTQLNIVAAVRGESGDGTDGARRGRRRMAWLIPGIPALILFPPLGIYLVLRRALGLPWHLITGPGGVAFAVIALGLAYATDLAFFASGSVSLLILASAVIARSLGVAARPTWSIAGALLSVYWLTPEGVPIPPGEFKGNMEMFVLSGVMIVTGFTLVIVFNARLLTTLFAAQRKGPRRLVAPALLLTGAAAAAVTGPFAGSFWGGVGELAFMLAGFLAIFGFLAVTALRVPRFSPALKMGIAYPLANRFRTGMTIAMFSLVVFSLTVMGILNASFLAVFATEAGRGGWDVAVSSNRSNPIPDIVSALQEEGSFDTSKISAVGHVTTFDNESQQARAPGQEWSEYPVIAGDKGMWTAAEMLLEARGRGYATDEDVFAAVAAGGPVAIVDSSVLQAPFAGGNMMLSVDVDIQNGSFEPFVLEIGDRVSGRTLEVLVIGILSGHIPPNLLFGVYTNEDSYRQVLGEPDYNLRYLRLANGTDAEAAAKEIRSALVTAGVDAISLKKAIDDAMEISRGFLRIFQAFMGLGLFVGIAALGVIALRSVVERRQQIGMLRAIGYQRGTVALSFVLESGFVALTGILSGVVGGSLLTWTLLKSDYFAGASGVDYFIPWPEIVIINTLAFGFALAMTWWPSRRAASVPVAEALRYE